MGHTALEEPVALRISALVCALALTACGDGTDNLASDDGGPGDGGAGADGGGDDDGCPPYQDLCGGRCVPITVDPDNCGGCGIECTGEQACSAGACSDTCLDGTIICDNR